MSVMEEIRDLLFQIRQLLRMKLGLDVRPRNWHYNKTLTATTEQPYYPYKELGKQGARFLRITVNKACTLIIVHETLNQRETFEEGLKPGKVYTFRFLAPLTLKEFYITPSATNTNIIFWASTVENPIESEVDFSHLDGETFTAASDRAALMAGKDSANIIRVLTVDASGHLTVVYKANRFTAQNLTINDANITADGSFKEFDITTDIDVVDIPNSFIVLQIIITQLTFAANMNITFQLWEKDSAGYNPATRAHFYMKILERDIINNDGEWSEIIEGELSYRDRNGTNEIHGRLVNNVGGEASDFAVVIKGRVGLDNTTTGDGGAVS